MKPFYAREALLGGVVLAASIILSSASPAQNGYAVTENSVGADSAASSPGPVRMARVSYLTGASSWRPSDSVDWSKGSINTPLRQGAQIWAKSGRDEVQFDDGSTMRLGGGALAVLQTMYSDANGEFTEIKQTAGLASYNLRVNVSEYQIDTPCASVKAYGPTNMRIGVGNVVEVVVHSGQAVVSSSDGEKTLKAGQRADIKCTMSLGPTAASVAYHSSKTKSVYGLRRAPRVKGAR